MDKVDPALRIDPKVVKLRDLLAHGRVISSASDVSNPRIVKFSQPKDGKVTVEAAMSMTEEWMSEQFGLTFEQFQKAKNALLKQVSG